MLGLNSVTLLAVDSLIRVQVRATNAKSDGAYSELNIIGATVETIPAVMIAPTILTSSITNISIPITWSTPTGTNAGGNAVTITSYEISHSIDGADFISIGVVTGNTYPHTITPSASTHAYKIRAINKYGT